MIDFIRPNHSNRADASQRAKTRQEENPLLHCLPMQAYW
jgi:hypothetical protein